MKKTYLALFLFALVPTHSSAQASSEFDLNDLETGDCNSVIAGSTNSKRMIDNAIVKAQSFCGSKGMKRGSKRSDYNATTESSASTFCRVTGKVICNLGAAPQIPDSYKIQGCTVKTTYSLGRRDGNAHNFCISQSWLGGEIAGYCWKVSVGETTPATAFQACPRLWRYYNDHNCAHLSAEDAATLNTCGH